ncbi:hypothetical protein Acr_25g0002360 [Actinidia rufa]|uniref:Uncharacterized protein n=1 Tax=Actinidia rufa TaxID=165716 RepID=A0A7J0GYB7_9ERIC|nr:hypothetical protein Acr_25g0002360 [Actinidia rufa]
MLSTPRSRRGAVKGNFTMQVTFCPLLCLGIATDRCLSAKPQRGCPVELVIERQFDSDACLSSDSGNVYAPLHRSLILEELSAQLDKGATIAREHDSFEEAASSSFSSGLAIDDEKEEEAPQLVRSKQRVAALVLLLSSDFDNSYNLGLSQLQFVDEDIIEHSYIRDSAQEKFRWVEVSLFDAPLRDKCKGKKAVEGLSKRQKKGKTSSAALSPIEQAELWKFEFFIVELNKRWHGLGEVAAIGIDGDGGEKREGRTKDANLDLSPEV